MSLNRTIEYNQNTQGEFGFGVAFQRAIFKDKKANLLVGIGYDYYKIKEHRIVSDKRILTEANYTINDVFVPIGFCYNFGSNSNFFFDIGGELHFILNAKVSGNTSTIYSLNESNYNGKAHLRNFNIAAFAGVSYKIPINNSSSIYIKLNYNYGFLSLLEDNQLRLSAAKFVVGFCF